MNKGFFLKTVGLVVILVVIVGMIDYARLAPAPALSPAPEVSKEDFQKFQTELEKKFSKFEEELKAIREELSEARTQTEMAELLRRLEGVEKAIFDFTRYYPYYPDPSSYPLPYQPPETDRFVAYLYEGRNFERYVDSFVDYYPINHRFEFGGPPGFPHLVDYFSIRWKGRFYFSAGTYRFTASYDDGVRLWVDGKLLIDDWDSDGPTETSYATIYLSSGYYDIRLDYFEDYWKGDVRLTWQRVNRDP